MRISERKRRLRARGIVPSSEHVNVVPRQQGSKSAVRGAARPAPRVRRQTSPTMQMVFGALYLFFSPLLFLWNLAILNNPHLKTRPQGFEAAFQLAMPVLFFLFGVWWVYKGWQGRAKQRAQATIEEGTISSKK